MRSIVKCIYEHSVETPDKCAVIATDCEVSYAALWRGISRVSALLKQQGIKKGDRIMVEAGPTVE